MGSKDQLKRLVCEAVDRRADMIVELGETILRNPETGSDEVRTAALVARHMDALRLAPRPGLGADGGQGGLAGWANAGIAARLYRRAQRPAHLRAPLLCFYRVAVL